MHIQELVYKCDMDFAGSKTMGKCNGKRSCEQFKLRMMMETTELYIVVPVCMTLTFIQDHSYVRYQEFC